MTTTTGGATCGSTAGPGGASAGTSWSGRVTTDRGYSRASGTPSIPSPPRALSRRDSRHYRWHVRDEAFRFLRDSFYVTVGFGVLAVQKLQVRRRELEKALDQQLAAPRQQLA